uniref:Secreted protein n=1 Tax=Steinernema glaseri TaxID=37863 RepID=A0A1I7Y427_9BILA
MCTLSTTVIERSTALLPVFSLFYGVFLFSILTPRKVKCDHCALDAPCVILVREKLHLSSALLSSTKVHSPSIVNSYLASASRIRNFATAYLLFVLFPVEDTVTGSYFLHCLLIRKTHLIECLLRLHEPTVPPTFP